ncbi:hypothetical protein PR048_023670, partial [Dryococelus australis]
MFNFSSIGSGDLPCVKILREKYVPLLKEDRAAGIKQDVCGNSVCILVDETKDRRGKCVFVILFRLLEPTDSQKIFVAGVHFLEQANARLCARAVLDSMKELVLGDQILHFLCWAHKLNIVGSIYPKVLTELNTAISKVKSAFFNTRKRKFLMEKYPNEEKDVVDLPDVGIEYFNSSSQLDANKILVQSTFVKEHLKSLIRIFSTDTTAALKTIENKVCPAEVKNGLQHAASLSMDKLQLLMASDPVKIFFQTLGKLFDTSKILLNEVNNDLFDLLTTFPGMKNCNLTSTNIVR